MTTTADLFGDECDRVVEELNREAAGGGEDEAGPRRESAEEKAKHHAVQPWARWLDLFKTWYMRITFTFITVVIVECLVHSKILDEPHAWFDRGYGFVLLLEKLRV